MDRLRKHGAFQEDIDSLEEALQQALQQTRRPAASAGVSLETLKALQKAMVVVSSRLSLEAVLEATGEHMVHLLQVDACAISRWDPHAGTVTLWVEHAPEDWVVGEEWYQPYDLTEFPLTRRVLETGETVQCRLDDPALDPAERRFMQESEISTLLMMPLVAQNRTIGLVELMDSREKRSFTSREIALGELLARHAAIVIERAMLLKALQDRADRLEALGQASLALTESLNLNQVLDAILRSTRHLIPGTHNADIFLYDSKQLTFGASIDGTGTNEKPFAVPREDGLTATVASRGEPVVVENMREHPLFADTPDHWTGSIVGLPLKFGERVVGVMNVANDHPNAFSNDELHILRMLGDQAAIAIENARLHNLVSEQARTDIVTGLANRRALDRRLGEETQRSDRYNRPFTLLMMDLDNFKAINDTYGHPVGDQVLVAVARCLESVVRDTDFLARFGGDEFSLVLPETDVTDAKRLALRVLEALERCALPLPDEHRVSLTASIGLASFPAHARTGTALLIAADQALYRAKERKPGGIVSAPA